MSLWPWVSRSKLLLTERQLRETRAAMDVMAKRLKELDELRLRQQDELIALQRPKRRKARR